MIYGWDHPATAARYERFCERHDRYALANQRLIAEADVRPGQRLLDLAAGTGRTAEQALAAGARVVCWEPAAAMRRVGQRRVPQAQWVDSPLLTEFDRVLCGAAAWQWQPFSSFVALAGAALRTGGALAFTMPSLYLGIPDEPGGGSDPLLVEFAGRLARGAVPQAPPLNATLSPEAVQAELEQAGLDARSWTFHLRVSQECLCDWYRIPVLTDALLGGMSVNERDARIDEVRSEVDLRSWKREGWMGWTAWKR